MCVRFCICEFELTALTATLSAVPPDRRLLWEETLLDALLNFAATPKGLLLLQQTGATDECVSYMFSRFTQKLQVCAHKHTNSTQWRGGQGQQHLLSRSNQKDIYL